MFKNRKFEVRVVKDDETANSSIPPFNELHYINIDGRRIVENAIKFYGAYKAINLASDMVQHIVVKKI